MLLGLHTGRGSVEETVKNLYVILAFHAHEPLWDLPRRLIRGATDRRVADAVLPESYIRRRFKEGRNVYRDLVALAESLGIPVALDITNELLFQIRRYGPGTLRELCRAYRDGVIAPLYTCAHHAHPALLSGEELADELRLNQEFLHDVLGVPRPRRPGIFFTECSIDGRHVPVVEAMGLEYTLVPELTPQRTSYRAPPGIDLQYRPFRVGERLIGLPRHFDVSQEIWRPLTLRDPDRVKYQGFLVGEMPVFPEEYQGAPLAEPRPSDPSSAKEYAVVLRRAVDEAPEGGLLLYVQDLELMDFGEAALSVLRDAWREVLADGEVRLHFVTPEQYLDALDVEASELPRVKVWQVSWAPEIRPALRTDGHYPPRRAGRFRGYDADAQVYRRWPFVFWEAGRFPTTLFDWLLDRFGFDHRVGATAGVLVEEEYQVDRLPPRVRLPLLARLAKRACNYGWYPEEGMHKRVYLDGMLIAEALALELKLRRAPPSLGDGLPPWVLPGMARLSELLVVPRIEYLRFGLERWREERAADPTPALLELEHARAMRRMAREELLSAADAYETLVDDPAEAGSWAELLDRVGEHCKAMFLSLDHLQRAWGKADADFLIVPMYRFLYDSYPPRMPAVLEELAARWGFEPTTEMPFEEGVQGSAEQSRALSSVESGPSL
ncbi:MAG: hypothetical protein HY698_11550 [Deltaproteobacteria bacterium]|nr:hypothetical protein [Deltaproteobacteria bacterium]